MSERIAPIEHSTGIPLSIVYDTGISDPNCRFDWHHSYYPKRRYELTSETGKALRSSRVQYVPCDLHRAYHYYFDEYINKWRLPQSKLDKCAVVILLSAGYVPDVGVKISKYGPMPIKLGEDEKCKLWENQLVRVDSESNIYNFILNTILEIIKNEDIDSKMIDEFTSTKNDFDRIRLGNSLLEIASRQLTDKMLSTYTSASSSGQLNPSSPNDPVEYIKESVFGSKKRMRRARTEILRIFTEVDKNVTSNYWY